MLLRHSHLSVLEHAYATFRIKGGSRAFTHQIVRHRIASFSQQSQRYVSEANFDYVIPDTIKENPAAYSTYQEVMKAIRKCYGQLQELGIPKEDARFVLPNAVTSEIVISANLREWRHIFSVRCEAHAQWEVRTICIQMLELLQEAVPQCSLTLSLTRTAWWPRSKALGCDTRIWRGGSSTVFKQGMPLRGKEI